MDKRETGKTITIKINGKHQAFEETRQKSDRKQVHVIENKKDKNKTEQETQHPKSEKLKTEKIPQKENKAFNTIDEMAVAHDPSDESFDWILPEATPEKIVVNEYKKVKEPGKLQKKPKKWPIGKHKVNRRMFTTIFTAVFFAVLLGTSFGFIMLKLVFIEKPVETSLIQKPETTVSGPKQIQNQTAKLSLVPPTITTWVVQEGVYSNKDSANQIVNSLKERGASAATFEFNGQSFLLVGVADTKEHAKALGANVKESGVVEFIPKQMSFSGKEISGLEEQEKVYIEAIPLLLETITTAASTASLSNSIPKALFDSIDQQTEKIAVKKDKTIKNEKIKILKEQVDAAVNNINSMKKSVDKQELTSLQQHLLAILIAYQTL